MVTPINEPIQVLVHFKHARLIPLRFLWKNRSYHVDNITTQYHTHDGAIRHLHFAVQSNGNLYQLSYNLSHHSWTLTSIHTPN